MVADHDVVYTEGLLNYFEGMHTKGLPVKRSYLTVPLSTPADDSETDTGVDLPAGNLQIVDAFLVVTTAEATGGTKTLDVGTADGESGGDPDGFIDGQSVAATGVYRDRSALLVAVTVDGYTATARSIVYTAGSDDWAEFEGYLVLDILALNDW